MKENNMIERIEKMNLLDMNYNIENETIKPEDMVKFHGYVYKKVKNSDAKDKREVLSLLEKAMVMFKRKGKYKGADMMDFLFIQNCLFITASYFSFFEQSSFDEILGDLGVEIEQLEKRAHKLNKSSFFKFFSFYVIVLTVAILGNMGSIIMPETLSFFPTALGGAIVILFLVLLFFGRFIGAFLIPVAIVILSYFIETFIPIELMPKYSFIILVISIMLLVIQFVFKKLVKLGTITTSKQRKIKQFNSDLSLYKQSIKEILKTLSFTCDAMIQTYREYGENEEYIKKDVAYVQKFMEDPEAAPIYQESTKKLTRYYTYVLERLDKIEINQ